MGGSRERQKWTTTMELFNMAWRFFATRASQSSFHFDYSHWSQEPQQPIEENNNFLNDE